MPLFTFDELSSDSQETALKAAQDYNLETFNDPSGDNIDYYFAQRAMNGVVADGALKGFDKFFMDTGREDYVQLPDMEVKNSKDFFKFAGLSENIIDKVDVMFGEPEKYGNAEYDTEVQFRFPDGTSLTESFPLEDPGGGWDVISNLPEPDEVYEDYKKVYREAEDYTYSEEYAQETIDDNERQFDEDGVVMEYDGGDYSNSRYRQKQEMKQKERERQRVNALKAMARVSKVKSKELIF